MHVITSSRRRPPRLLVLLPLLAAFACDPDSSHVVSPLDTERRLALTITPAEFVVSEGDSVSFTAQLDGAPVLHSELEWRVTPATAATIDERGILRATARGAITVSATRGAYRSSTTGTIYGTPVALVVLGETALTGSVGHATDSLAVRVTASDGSPVAGAAVGFEVRSGGGSLNAAQSVSGSDGVARVEWTLGPRPGPQSVVAGLEGVGTTRFDAVADVDRSSATARVVSGDGQEAEAGVMLAEPLVLMVEDAFGNPVGAMGVQWIFPSGVAGSLAELAQGGATATPQTTTDSAGSTSVYWRLGTTAGDHDVAINLMIPAEDTGIPAARGGGKKFGGRSKAGVPRRITVAPDTLHLDAGERGNLQATVVDRYGNEVVGAVASWSSSQETVAVIDGSGSVDGQSAGSAVGTATFDAISSQALVLVQAADPVVVQSGGALPPGTVGTGYRYELGATGGSGSYAWTLDSGELPAGLTLGGSDGVIAGTPTAAASATFTVKATATGGDEGVAAFSMAVSEAATAAAVTVQTTSLPAGIVGDTYSAQLVATGGDEANVWAIASGSLPAGLMLNAATGGIAGTLSSTGTASFVVRVTSGGGRTDSQALSIGVSDGLTIIAQSLANGRVGSAYSAALSAQGGSGARSWSITAGQLPNGLTIGASDGALTGTPSQPGAFTFDVRVQTPDGQSDVRTFSLGVYGILSVTTSALPSATAGSAFSATTSASGGDGVYQWSLSSGALPPGLTLSSGGTITGVPNSAGSFDFSLLVVSGDGQSRARPLSIDVGGAPVASGNQPFFSDDFETCDLTSTGGGFAWTGGAVNVTVDGVNPRTGSCAMAFYYRPKPDLQDAIAEQRATFNPVDEVWIEYDWYLPSNYFHRHQTSNGVNNKFIRIWGGSYGGNNPKAGASLDPDYPSWGVSNGNSQIYGQWGDHDNVIMSGQDGARWFGVGTGSGRAQTIEHGSWAQIRWHFKLSSGEDVNDGEYTLYIDGAPVITKTNLDFFGTGAAGNNFDQMYLMGWSNSGFTEGTTFYIDNYKMWDVNPGW